ncbi:MAG: c-type cytochrome, partial [Chloroflexota bacterium]|nr:c-type cytochrome [Chloroflexota bacterium]
IAIIGAINLFTIKPRLQSNDSSGNWLRRLILIEVGLALVILCLVGILTSLQPGRQVASQQAQEAQKQITLQDASEGLDIALRIEPGRVGVNNIYISLTDQRNNLPKNITDLELTLSYVDKDIGSITETVQKVDTGQYILKNQLISLIGTWQIETVVRQSDNFDARTAFRFQVNAPLGNFEDFTPSRELGRLLWGIELILIGFLFILTGIPLGGWWKPQGALIMGSGLTAFILGIFLAVSTDFFSSEPSTVLINPFPPTNESLTIGRQIYKLRCQSCHGIEGLGDGPASYNLNPRPADLSVHVPLHPEAALFDFVKHGIPGTAMLPLEDELTDDEIWHTINHVKTLGVTGNRP